jgi:hypothetical protein
LNPYATLLPGADDYFSYTGSLTTPPCNTNATWIVLSTPVPISSDDLDILRGILLQVNNTLAESDGSTNRPVVPVAGRLVTFSSAFTVTDDAKDLVDDDDNEDQKVLAIAYTALALGIFATLTGLVGLFALYRLQRQRSFTQHPLL